MTERTYHALSLNWLRFEWPTPRLASRPPGSTSLLQYCKHRPNRVERSVSVRVHFQEPHRFLTPGLH